MFDEPISTFYFTRLEKGEVNPHLTTVMNISRALGKKPLELFTSGLRYYCGSTDKLGEPDDQCTTFSGYAMHKLLKDDIGATIHLKMLIMNKGEIPEPIEDPREIVYIVLQGVVRFTFIEDEHYQVQEEEDMSDLLEQYTTLHIQDKRKHKFASVVGESRLLAVFRR